MTSGAKKTTRKALHRFRSIAATLAVVALLLASPTGAVAQEADSTAPVSGKLPPNAAPPAKKVGPGAPAAPAAAAKPAAPAGGGIHLSPTTPLAAGVVVHDKILSECRIQTDLPRAIAERNSDVVLSDKPGGRRLDLKIIDVQAPSGGWFSGPKWITVEGRLLRGKALEGSFIAKETSMASATACGMLGKVIRVLGDDIAAWLRHPAKNSKLGSAR